ncbi:AAA family ATPase [Edaphovirga cremea]|uniref:AAA family ATPase n=1 Tax=Edaphovirga cremea TaxID=2267246 RepID=UPI003989CFC9
MAKLSNLKETKIKHIMMFGPPKSGKTRRAGELAKYKNLIWFDLENGFGTLFQLPQDLQERIEVIHIPDNRGTPMAIETMLKVIKGLKVTICEDHGKVTCPLCTPKEDKVKVTVELNALDNDTCVVVDSCTQLTNSAIANITKGKPDDYKLEYDDWAHLGKLMDTFFSYVQSAPFNVICISHESEVKMVDKSAKLVPVGGTSNFSRNVAKYFDEVIYCRVVNGKHVMASSTATDNNILTGSRANVDLAKDPNANLIVLWGSAEAK